MGILRNRRVFGRALVSTLAFAVSVGLLALWETGRGTVLSASADTSAPEFAYSGDNGPETGAQFAAPWAKTTSDDADCQLGTPSGR
jgi:hypothetical protein